MINDWINSLDAAITVCNRDGIITYMNEKSILNFSKYGGEKLIGTNLLDCHPGESKIKLAELLSKELKNIYTTQSGDKHKLIYQLPVYENGEYTAYMEIVIDLPENLATHKR
jgi:transcriptional regulator with PAS, ATPase and Fis domain